MSKNQNSNLGLFLKERRERRGMTQKEVADHFGFTTSQFISNIERGLSPAPVNVLVKFMELYKISEKEMLGAIMTEQERYWKSQLGGHRKGRRAANSL